MRELRQQGRERQQEEGDNRLLYWVTAILLPCKNYTIVLWRSNQLSTFDQSVTGTYNGVIVSNVKVDKTQVCLDGFAEVNGACTGIQLLLQLPARLQLLQLLLLQLPVLLQQPQPRRVAMTSLLRFTSLCSIVSLETATPAGTQATGVGYVLETSPLEFILSMLWKWRRACVYLEPKGAVFALSCFMLCGFITYNWLMWRRRLVVTTQSSPFVYEGGLETGRSYQWRGISFSLLHRSNQTLILADGVRLHRRSIVLTQHCEGCDLVDRPLF